VRAEIEALLAATNWTAAAPRLLHADLTEDHLLVERRGEQWQIAGLLDWADAEVGDPYYEWVALWFSICRREGRLLRAFMRGYDAGRLDRSLSATRLTAFTFLHRFGVGILGDTLTQEEQRAIGSLDELIRVLFPGLPA
jgi:aminoglycoside phosphotransferase (APT) family kinase protein